MYLACLTKIAAGVGCAALLLAGGDAPLSVARTIAPRSHRRPPGAGASSARSRCPTPPCSRGLLPGAAGFLALPRERRRSQRAGSGLAGGHGRRAPARHHRGGPIVRCERGGRAVLRSPANSPYRRLGLGQAPEPARRPVGGVPGSGLSLFAKTHATRICIPLTYSQRGDPRIWKACTLSASPGRARNRGCDCSLPCLRPSFRRPARCTKCLLTCRQEP